MANFLYLFLAKEFQFKWRNLRTSFKRELKIQKKSKCAQMSYKRRKYIYFDQLLFLLPYMEDKETTTSNSNAYEDDIILVDDKDDFQNETPTINKNRAPTINKNAPPTTNENEAKQNAKEAPFEEILLDFPKKIDEDKSFLISLVPSFKKMSQTQKIDAKIGILSVIKRVTQTTSNSNSNYEPANVSEDEPSP